MRKVEGVALSRNKRDCSKPCGTAPLSRISIIDSMYSTNMPPLTSVKMFLWQVFRPEVKKLQEVQTPYETTNQVYRGHGTFANWRM